jgi:hypothetical protein
MLRQCGAPGGTRGLHVAAWSSHASSFTGIAQVMQPTCSDSHCDGTASSSFACLLPVADSPTLHPPT